MNNNLRKQFQVGNEIRGVANQATGDEPKTLVTGGLGYLGTVLVPMLAQRGPVRVYDTMLFGNAIEDTPNVEFIKGNITDLDHFERACEGVMTVIHLAAIVTDALVDMNPVLGREVNVQATSEILRRAHRKGVRRFIYASSSSVYGSYDVPASEANEVHPETEYAMQKYHAETPVLNWSDKMTTCVVRMATLCGKAPRMRLDTIVNIFTSQAYFDGAITVWGDGSQSRCNLAITDAARFYRLISAIEPDRINGEIFNIGGANLTATEIAEVVSRKAKVSIHYKPENFDTRHYMLSSAKAERMLHWTPATPLKTVIDQNIEFFKKGGVADYKDPIYRNTERMKSIMLTGY